MIRKENNTSERIKKLVILMVIILGLLLIAVLAINNNPTNKNLRFIYNDNKDTNISVMPTNVDKLFVNYKGNVSQKSIYKSMDIFTTKLVEKYYSETNQLSIEEIEKYYNKNSTMIEKELGITDYNKFFNFCDNLKSNLKESNLNLISYTINPNTIKKINNQTIAVIIVNYENNDPIAFTLRIQNAVDKGKTPIYFEECIDEKIKSYEYKPNEYETPDLIEPTGRVIN